MWGFTFTLGFIGQKFHHRNDGNGLDAKSPATWSNTSMACTYMLPSSMGLNIWLYEISRTKIIDQFPDYTYFNLLECTILEYLPWYNIVFNLFYFTNEEKILDNNAVSSMNHTIQFITPNL